MKKYIISFSVAFVALFVGFFFLTKYMSDGNFLKGNKQENAPAVLVSPIVANASGAAEPVATALLVPTPQVGENFEATPLQVLENSERRISFSNKGACIKNADLTQFKVSTKNQVPASTLHRYLDCSLFGVKFGTFDFRNTPAFLVSHSENSRILVMQNGDLFLTKEFIFEKGNYTGTMKIRLENKSNQAYTAPLAVDLGVHSEQKDSGGILNTIPMELSGVVYEISEKVQRKHVSFEAAPKLENLLTETAQPIAWAGSETTYFLNAIAPVQKGFFDLKVLRTGQNIQPNSTSVEVRNIVEAWLEQSVTLAAQSTYEAQFQTYVGPKSKTQLEVMGAKQAGLNLVPSIDYGMFRIVAWPMYKVLGFLHNLTGNWGWAIILLTLAIKILFIPLMAKAFSAGKKMQEIQPELNALKEKFKDDKQMQQKELMALMSKKGVNPMSGCLPILPQIPVFFGLNAVLTHTFELRQAPWLGWILDLASKDPYYVSPAVMAVLMFVQQKLTPMPSMEPAQQKIMQWMPVIFAVFMLAYPSGLVLYIMTNTIVSVLQQQYMMKRYNDAQLK